MASRIIHYIIAKKLLEQWDLDDNDFILGNLIPDAYDGTLQGYSHSHFGDIVIDKYTQLSDTEYQKFKDKYLVHFNESIVLGYYCHLLSDYEWVQLNVSGITKNLAHDSEEFLLLRKRKHEDYARLNTVLIHHFDLDIPKKYRISNQLIITEIDKSYIPAVCNGLEQDFKNTLDGKLTMLNLDRILDYIDKAISVCSENIKDYCAK